MPSSKRATKYGIMNAPPPFCTAWPGKRRKLPRPTAEPATARITPSRLFQWSALRSCGLSALATTAPLRLQRLVLDHVFQIMPQRAVMDAVEEVDDQTDREPAEEAIPVFGR